MHFGVEVEVLRCRHARADRLGRELGGNGRQDALGLAPVVLAVGGMGEDQPQQRESASACATAVQHLVPQHRRATASASFLLINNLIGIGVGPWLMGTLSDALKTSYGQEALRYATVGCLGFYLLAAALMLMAVKPLRRGWVD